MVEAASKTPPFDGATSPAVELSPGRLYALGDLIPLDGRVSWVAEGCSGYESFNCFLIREGDAALLVDTGAGAHAELVVDQLLGLLPEGSDLTILLTRTEPDCALNIPVIEQRFCVDAVHYTGGITLPHALRAETRRVRVNSGETEWLECANGIRLEVLSPRLRMLAALWAYDPVSRVFFTSEAFGHVRGTTRVVFDHAPDAHEIRATLLAKFWWLARADTHLVADEVHRLFAERDVDAIAPTHGSALVGREQVHRHAGAVERVIRELSL